MVLSVSASSNPLQGQMFPLLPQLNRHQGKPHPVAKTELRQPHPKLEILRSGFFDLCWHYRAIIHHYV